MHTVISPEQLHPSCTAAPTWGPPQSEHVRFVSRSAIRAYRDPIEIVQANELSAVVPGLKRIQGFVDRGFHAAGFISYEAAPAFDSAFKTRPSTDLPLLWFGIYKDAQGTPELSGARAWSGPIAWEPLITPAQYRSAFARIHELIASGDTYQVNYTYPLRARIERDPYALFERLCSVQRAEYCAYIDCGRHKILSASPELFFRLDGRRLITRPMKGTARRGLWYDDDRDRARRLRESPKERAENVMIVDLLRNDMGRVSEVGSVNVERLFDVERYETVWQMTSTVSSVTNASVPEILAALFPSGSVTGVPKVRTMQIIHELEPFPRGVYCGAIGWWTPDRQAEFNVAIRTATIDTETAEAAYHIGSGITWDSVAEAEHEECSLKAAVLNHRVADFELLESLLLDNGYFLLEAHLERLGQSAAYFDVPFDDAAARTALQEAARAATVKPAKVRLRLARCGTVHLDVEPVALTGPPKLGFAAKPIDSSNPFLYHKTTRHEHYEASRRARPAFDDVLLWNERGEITESTVANVVIRRGGRWLTPPVSSGLLPGLMRAHLLRAGQIQEAVLTKEDIRNADTVRLINSVRKWIDVRFGDRRRSAP